MVTTASPPGTSTTLIERLQRNFGEGYKTLERYHSSTGIPLSLPTFIAFLFILAIMTALILIYVANAGPFLAIVTFLAITSLAVGVPLTLRAGRVDAIDNALPDVLKHMSIVLVAGGTVVSAVEEVAESEYGPISDYFKTALKQMQEGRPFEDVLTENALDSGSTLFVRSTAIVVDAKKAGAGLADVMTAIADDTREAMRIKRERVSRTTMHVTFLLMAGLFLSPFIFGFTLSIVSFINQNINTALPGDEAAAASATPQAATGASFFTGATITYEDFNALLLGFISAQTILTGIAIGVIREGRFLRFLVAMPFMVLTSLVMYEGGKFLALAIIGN